MAEHKRGWTDTQVNHAIGNLLRSGVILSAVVVLLGGILLLVQEGQTDPKNMSVFHGEPAAVETSTASSSTPSASTPAASSSSA